MQSNLSLKSIAYCSNALSLLEQARQQLLNVGCDEIYAIAKQIEDVYTTLRDATETNTGIKWSQDNG